MKAKLKVRVARALLHEAFESNELDDYEEACLRSAVSSLDGALHEAHPPIGTTFIGKESKEALDEHLENWGKPTKPRDPPLRSQESPKRQGRTTKSHHICHNCVHRRWAGFCEEFPDRTTDAHDGRDCDRFEAGDGLLHSCEEVDAFKKERGLR